MCGFTLEEFEGIVELARECLERPMDPRLQFSVEMNVLRHPPRRVCSAHEAYCLTLLCLRGGDQGALPIRTVAFTASLSPATVRNNFYHGLFLFMALFMLACVIL